MKQLTKKELLQICENLGITKNIKSKTKDQLKQIIENAQKKEENILLQKEFSPRIKYVYHSADIHIRTLERHSEYTQVFDSLVDYLKSQDHLENSVFVICGDIFHNRDKLLSETIILFNKFLEKLTSIIDVVMIPGNHDTFVSNNRLDTISGIVSIKKYPGLHYLKDPGIYTFSNIDFIYITPDTIKEKGVDYSNKSNEFNIVLFHGIVSGSKLDSRHTLSSTINLNTFEKYNYDYVLLGDIHLRQFLDKNVAYPGSLIQQNHGEERDHGILKWDIITGESEFIKIHNDYGFINVYTYLDSKGDISIKDIENLELPRYSRIKIFYDYYTVNSNNGSENIIKDILTKHGTEVLSIQKEILESRYNRILNIQQTESCSREDIEKEIFESVVKKIECKEELFQIHSEYLKDHLNYSSNRDSRWKILEIEFMNIFIYGDNHVNKISFDNNTGTDTGNIIGILGNNAIGKSSIIQIILYCLFGNISKSKSYSNRNIINKKEKNFYIKMTILLDSKKYIITRKGNSRTKKGNICMEEDIAFKCVTDDIDYTDSKINTVNKIQKMLGISEGKDLFILTNVMSYTNYISLLDMSSSELSSIFTRLFNLQRYSDIYSDVLKRCRELNTEIKELQGEKKGIETVNEVDVLELKSEITSVCSEIKLMESEISEIEQEKENLLRKFSYDHDISEEFIKKVKECDTQELETKISELTICSHCITGNKENTIDDICFDFLDKKIRDLETKKGILEKNIKSSVTAKKYTNQEYLKAKEHVESNLGIESFLEDLNNCKKVRDYYLLDSELFLDLVDLLKFIQKESKSLVKFTHIISEYEKYIEQEKNIKYLKEEIYKIETEISLLETKKSKILEDLSEYQEISEILENINKYNKHLDLALKKKALESKYSVLSNKKTKMTMKLGKLNNKLDSYTHSIERIKILNNKISDLQHSEKILKYYKGVVNDKCLPRLILMNTIKKIEYEANILTYKLAGISVILNDTYQENEEIEAESKWEIKLKKNGMILGSEQVSGYEKFIVNMGLKIALDKCKEFPGAKFFVIDEVFDVVSQENFDRVDCLFDSLRRYYNTVLVVSHNEELKKKVNSKIEISSNFDCSKIIQ
ncbi:MAG TPA: metallophosphoesterase [Allocoleopsis sp.]